ncbi:MAG TPA: tRNA pseudouridine(38-40) synthase TruA [Deltaproteobacteria bacterium]|nr:tRNA pseudouridine(38-40) synthase TruA [Deltaproteobacteria bacterium]
MISLVKPRKDNSLEGHEIFKDNDQYSFTLKFIENIYSPCLSLVYSYISSAIIMPTLRNLKITLAYDGSGFHGWQLQPGKRTVQETVEAALESILQHDIRVTASGRTDAGVHALGQVINFFTPLSIPEKGLLKAMNSIFPSDISALEVKEVEPAFHARYRAKSKTYIYILETAEILSPFLSRYALHIPCKLDIEAMGLSVKILEGEHDFRSFMAAGSTVKTTKRRILAADIASKGSQIFFFIQGSGFLRHMVRNIVGTLILVGQGKIAPDEVDRIIACRDRASAGPTAPPQGLYLVGVDYGEGLRNSHSPSEMTSAGRRQCNNY